MYENPVKEWMSTSVITVSPDTTLPEAHALMAEHKIRRLVVVDGNKVVGMVTRGDVRGAEPSEATTLSIFEVNYLLARLTVSKIMSKDIASIGPDEPIGKAASLMDEKKISGLPVMDGGKLAGIITESDIFRMVVAGWKETAKA